MTATQRKWNLENMRGEKISKLWNKYYSKARSFSETYIIHHHRDDPKVRERRKQ